jgi:hypothetical protein
MGAIIMPKAYEHLRPHLDVLLRFRSKPITEINNHEVNHKINARFIDESVVLRAMHEIEVWARNNTNKIQIMDLVKELRARGFILTKDLKLVPVEEMTLKMTEPDIEELKKDFSKKEVFEIELLALRHRHDPVFIEKLKTYLKSKGFNLTSDFNVEIIQ